MVMAEEPKSAEESIIEARRAKADPVRAPGENPFANDTRTHGPIDDIDDVRQSVAGAAEGGKYAAESVQRLAQGRAWHGCGRVLALRSTGALSFARVRDRTGEIQLMLDQSL